MSEHYEKQAASFLGGMVSTIAGPLAAKAESPIELGLLYGFITFWAVDRRLQIDGMNYGPLETEWTARVFQQHKVGKFRVDFGVHITGSYAGKHLSKWIAVECDGHEFHDRTREQAARDKSRDRELAAAGYHVLRFTGSEIHFDAIKCALDVMKVAQRIVDEWLPKE